MGTSFTNFRLFFHTLFIINTLFPLLHETLYAGHIKLFTEVSELFTPAFSSHHHSQNSILGGQSDGKLEGAKSGL
jgi:hypothetical protein